MSGCKRINHSACKGFDIRTLAAATGQERTGEDHPDHLADADREYVETHNPENETTRAIEAAATRPEE